MDLILDTCGLLSLIGIADKKLSQSALKRIATAEHVYVSSCSMFEIAIKHKKRMIDLGVFASADQLWTTAFEEYDLTELPVTHDVFYESVLLDNHHADPFDRIIIAHARKLGLPIVTYDGLFEAYDIRLIS